MPRLDFSQFHPLDHKLWECNGLPGGWRNHIVLWWNYKFLEELEDATRGRVYRMFYCPRGLHDWVEYWQSAPHTLPDVNGPASGANCRWCDAER